MLSTVDNSTTNGTATDDTTKAATSPGSAFVLDASNSTKTQFFLVPVASKSSMVGNDTVSEDVTTPNTTSVPQEVSQDTEAIRVSLQVPVFDPELAAMSPYCATYERAPSAPAPLKMMQCNNTESGQSQLFAYDPNTGVVKPMWQIPGQLFNATTSALNTTVNATSSLAAHIKALSIKDDVSTDNSTQSTNTTSVPASGLTSAQATAQNVMLVFNALTPTVHDVKNPPAFKPISSSDPDTEPESISSDDDSATASAGASLDGSDATASSSSSSTLTASSTDAMSTDTTDSIVATSTSTDSSDTSATASDTDSPEETESSATDTTDAVSASATVSLDYSDTSSSSDSDSAAPTPTSTSVTDPGSMEMFQQQRPATRFMRQLW